ncbi:MAG TPA: hypothetical protein VFG10_10495 [Saprospiraceae bacterium]|nr:hypothetical protein [Saprospiraceae bacterium]
MKKYLLLICLTLPLSIYQLGAQDTASFKPMAGEWGFQLTAQGIGPLFEDNWEDVFINELHIKYAASEKRYYTLGLFINSFSDSNEQRDSVLLSSRTGLKTTTTSESQTSVFLVPGMECHFPGTRRIDPFMALRIPIGYIGKNKQEEESFENSIRTNGDIYQLTENEETTEAGGFQVGLSGLLGLNYYLTNRIAIGIDYSLSLQFSKSGGEIEETNSTRFVDGTTITTSNDASTSFDRDKEFDISNGGVLGLNFVFFFGKKSE